MKVAMGRIVINKTNLVLLFFLFNLNYISAQHKIDKELTFIGMLNTNYSTLNSFLCSFRYENIEVCENQSGLFKFDITPEGVIVSLVVEGNLPIDLVESVKKRILLTENKWIFHPNLAKKGKNITFYYPIYVQQPEKCKFKAHESYEVMRILFSKFSILPLDNGVYFIEPSLIYAAIR